MKESLFISYCWKDGTLYADELEMQLNEKFDVKRDKTQLITNDDLYDFMAEIASCDNVIIVLSEEYTKSLNCMLEMAYLVQQEDWKVKSMILVIDDKLYSIDSKVEIISHWKSYQKELEAKLEQQDEGKSIVLEEKEYVDLICDQIESFLKGISRRKNPSQIAIVNEIIKKSEVNKNVKRDIVSKGEEFVKTFLETNGKLTLRELADRTGKSTAATSRMLATLEEKGVIEKESAGKSVTYKIRDN